MGIDWLLVKQRITLHTCMNEYRFDTITNNNSLDIDIIVYMQTKSMHFSLKHTVHIVYIY